MWIEDRQARPCLSQFSIFDPRSSILLSRSPLGQSSYPGEKHPWPANSQWRWDKDGVVHYLLIFRRLIVELPEKVLHVKTLSRRPTPKFTCGISPSAKMIGS